MKNEEPNELFSLIKSLNKGERKTFTLFANYYSEGEKNYLRLFELIDSQKQYDEKIIKQKLKEEKILTALPKIKKYLQELILKSLRFYYSDKNCTGKLRGYLTDIEICQSRGLNKLAEKTLNTAKQLATANEKHLSLLELLIMENDHSIYEKHEKQLIEQEQIAERIIALRKYKQLGLKVNTLKKKGLIRDMGMQKEWDKIIEDPLLSLLTEPVGYEECLYFHNLSSIYYAETNNFAKDLYHTERLVEKMESRPELLLQNKIKYIAALNNLGVAWSINHEMVKVADILERLLQMQEWDLTPQENTKLDGCIALTFGSLLSLLVKKKNIDEGIILAARAEKFIKSKKIKVLFRSILFINLTSFYIHVGNFKAALNSVTPLLNELSANFREGLYAHAKIINLIIHYELESDQLLPHLIRSTYRYLYKRKILYKTEELILQFIRNKLPTANSRKELFECFKELKNELEEITKDPFEAKVLNYFDYINWLENKIENKSLPDILS